VIIEESCYPPVISQFPNIPDATKECSFHTAKLIGGWKDGNFLEIRKIVIMTAFHCECGQVNRTPRTLHLQKIDLWLTIIWDRAFLAISGYCNQGCIYIFSLCWVGSGSAKAGWPCTYLVDELQGLSLDTQAGRCMEL